MDTTWVKAVYAILLGVALALSVGFGVLTFETGPRPPQPPGLSFSALNGSTSDQDTARIGKQIDSFYSDLQAYRERYPNHQRNIFLWLAGAGMVLGVVGVALPRVVNHVRLGLLAGALLLILGGAWYAFQPVPQVVQSTASILSAGTPKTLDAAGRFLRFAVSIVGLLLLLFVGLWRLTDWPAPLFLETRPLPGSAPAGHEPDAASSASASAVPAAVPVVGPHREGEALKWGRPEERTNQGN